jgi:hypothetical protein
LNLKFADFKQKQKGFLKKNLVRTASLLGRAGSAGRPNSRQAQAGSKKKAG